MKTKLIFREHGAVLTTKQHDYDEPPEVGAILNLDGVSAKYRVTAVDGANVDVEPVAEGEQEHARMEHEPTPNQLAAKEGKAQEEPKAQVVPVNQDSKARVDQRLASEDKARADAKAEKAKAAAKK